MEKYYLDLIINEVKNFKELQKQWGYTDLDDLISHYIEENVISSKDELVEVSSAIKKRLGVMVKGKTFGDWWM